MSSDDWTVPAGDLAWGQTYYWTVQAYDGGLYSPSPQQYYFTTAVPQPLVTSQLSQNPSGPGFNPQTGNWTTSATDAQVPTVGPALEITRDYNSSDPRYRGAFGAGWSSVLDMKVSAGENGGTGATATQVVTYPDGEEVGFGLNPDGSTYSPPPGRYATLAPVTGGGFTLTDKNDTVYTFTQALSTGVYGITSITDALQRTAPGRRSEREGDACDGRCDDGRSPSCLHVRPDARGRDGRLFTGTAEGTRGFDSEDGLERRLHPTGAAGGGRPWRPICPRAVRPQMQIGRPGSSGRPLLVQIGCAAGRAPQTRPAGCTLARSGYSTRVIVDVSPPFSTLVTNVPRELANMPVPPVITPRVPPLRTWPLA